MSESMASFVKEYAEKVEVFALAVSRQNVAKQLLSNLNSLSESMLRLETGDLVNGDIRVKRADLLKVAEVYQTDIEAVSTEERTKLQEGATTLETLLSAKLLSPDKLAEEAERAVKAFRDASVTVIPSGTKAPKAS